LDVSAAGARTAATIVRVPPRPAVPELPFATLPFPVRPPVPVARMRRRHWGLLASFLLLVAAPAAAAAWYLWAIALDQYQSRIGFSVQREGTSSVVDMLGGMTEITGGGTSDTDILYRFLQSREMVAAAQRVLDLRALYVRPADPVFGLPADATVEDVEAHWNRKVDIFYDSASRLIEVRVLAFAPEDATRIAEVIAAESSRMLNRLSAQAREDATRHARAELAAAEERLRAARAALTAFRVETQIVDPLADIQGRMGLLNSLLAQQATALIDLDLLASNTSEGDPRMTQAEKRVAVIEARIAAERARFGEGGGTEEARYADLVARFEALAVDLEFAQAAYVAALATLDQARAEAQRQSRYLATYLSPTRAERAEFPQRALNLALVAGFLFASWAVAALVSAALRDRR
jgi:capsular polysaccharide transport system permease protein